MTSRRLLDLLWLVTEHPLVASKALDYAFVAGELTERLVLVLGENGAGKSLLRRVVSQTVGRDVVALSMEDRGYPSAAVDYAGEGQDSTGSLSARALRNTLARSGRRHREHIVVLDEPDLGASDNLAAGIGLALADWLASPQSEPAFGVFVTTHNRAMVTELIRGRSPHLLWFGPDAPGTVAEWLARPIVPRTLDEALASSRATETRVRRVLRQMRKGKT